LYLFPSLFHLILHAPLQQSSLFLQITELGQHCAATLYRFFWFVIGFMTTTDGEAISLASAEGSETRLATSAMLIPIPNKART
jgi:hypothetical protein